MRLHHIGVAVSDCKKAAEIWCKAGGYTLEVANVIDEERQVCIWILGSGLNPKLELLEPISSTSPISPILQRGIAAYHTCHEAVHLRTAIKAWQRHGAKLLSEPSPAPAFANRNVAFLFLPTKELVELLEA